MENENFEPTGKIDVVRKKRKSESTLIFIVAFVFLMVGLSGGVILTTTILNESNPIIQGHCESLGLTASIIPQKIDENIVVGIPVCVKNKAVTR